MDLWMCSLVSAVILSYSSQVANGHAQDFSRDDFISAVNRDDDGYITSTEVQGFLPGVAVTRCEFVALMIPRFSRDRTLVSLLYDVLQTYDDGDLSTLGRNEISQALLGQESSLDMEQFEESVKEKLKEIHDMRIRPYQFTEGPGRYEYDRFQVQAWADDVDTNRDGQVSAAEISRWMMDTLDADKNFQLERCEFVEAMRQYTQHPATAAKVYDVIFRSRDRTWADVDSAFLASLISKLDRPTITTNEFRDFFSYENEVAAGTHRSASESGSTGNAGTSVFTSCNAGLWLLVRTLPALLVALRVMEQ